MHRSIGVLLLVISMGIAHSADTWKESAIVPPATALVVTGSSSSDEFILKTEWEPNPEPDLSGYIIYRGRASRDYNESFKVSELPDQWSNPACTQPYDPKKKECCEFTLKGFGEGIYYMAATAYDTDGNESNYSDEASHSFHIHKRKVSAPTDVVNKGGKE